MTVDLTWTYSNQRDLADLLRRARLWITGDGWVPTNQQASVRARPAPAVPRRVVDRLGEDVIHEIIEARRTGMKVKDLTKGYGISESTVKRMLLSARSEINDVEG